jgi:hypothetical protein
MRTREPKAIRKIREYADTCARFLLRFSLTALLARYIKKGHKITVLTDDEGITPLNTRMYGKYRTITNATQLSEIQPQDTIIIISTRRPQQDNPNQQILDCPNVITLSKSPMLQAIAASGPDTADDAGPQKGTQLYTSNHGICLITSSTTDVTVKIPAAVTAIILTAYVAMMSLAGGFIPQDDLARHLKAYQYGYDFGKLFIYSYHPAYNTYALFDHIASTLYLAIGAPAATVLQIVPLAISLLALTKMMRKQDGNAASVAIVLFFAFTWYRYASGRPCVTISSLFLLAHAYRREMNAYMHLAMGILMGALYYLFFLYTIPLMTNRRTMAAYGAATAVSLLGWHYYSGGQYFHDLLSLATSTEAFSKSATAYYSEMRPSLSPVLLLYLAVLVPFLCRFRTKLHRSLSILWFLLLNQIRYMETAVPLMLTYFGSYVRTLPAYIAIAAISMGIAFIRPQPYDTVKLPAGSIVFTRSSAEMNAVVTATDNVRIVPSANIGWNTPEIRKAAIDLGTKKTFDCSILNRYKFDYLVENTMSRPPECLTFQESQGTYRIWKVKDQTANEPPREQPRGTAPSTTAGQNGPKREA